MLFMIFLKNLAVRGTNDHAERKVLLFGNTGGRIMKVFA